jgi:hypothetical protein
MYFCMDMPAAAKILVFHRDDGGQNEIPADEKLTISLVCISTNSANPLSRIHAVGSASIDGSGAAFFAIVTF